MARVTVEDCIDKVPNRFELVLLSAHRARALSRGAPLTIERDRDKNPVIALREIAERTVDPDELHEELIRSLQRQVEIDEPEPERVPEADDSPETRTMSEAELLAAMQAEAQRRSEPSEDLAIDLED